MSRTSHRRPRGFTLVELLVVLGIIALLMALLTPAVMWGINAARRTRMGVEIAALADAIEKYKLSTGDYPPSFRDSNAVLRHIRMRYPKIAPSEFNAVFTPAGIVRPAMQLDEGEALVFWLSRTRNNPTYPFGLTGGSPSDGYKTYYEFDARRLVDLDVNTAYTSPAPPIAPAGYPSIPSYRAAYAKDTFYLYIDNRSYDDLMITAATTPATGAYAEIDASAVSSWDHSMVTRPYFTDAGPPSFVNPTSFQILCAGQDGDWGNSDPADPNLWAGLKGFPGGQNYTPADRDNIANFSEGRTLEDHLP